QIFFACLLVVIRTGTGAELKDLALDRLCRLTCQNPAIAMMKPVGPTDKDGQGDRRNDDEIVQTEPAGEVLTRGWDRASIGNRLVQHDCCGQADGQSKDQTLHAAEEFLLADRCQVERPEPEPGLSQCAVSAELPTDAACEGFGRVTNRKCMEVS